MRILQINSVVNSGSTGRIAEDLGVVAISRGFESYIAYGRGDRPSKSNLIKIGGDLNVLLHGLNSVLLDRHGLSSVNATKEFILKIKHLNPNAIYLHNLHGYYLNYRLLFEYLSTLNIPLFWTLFDCWSFTGHCTYFDDVGCSKWKSICYKCPKTKMYPSALFMDNSKNNYLLKKSTFSDLKNLNLIVNSLWLKTLVNESFLSHLPIFHIASGIDTSIFKPLDNNTFKEKLGLTNYKIVLGVASIWDKRKGLNDFIELSHLLNTNIKIVLIGLNKKQISSLPKSIIGIERTENIDELVQYYNIADVFVNPTYQDNFPTTNLEALASGTPVITYNTGGSPEAVTDECGYVVAKGDIVKLKSAIENVLLVQKASFAESCRLRAIKYFKKEDRFNDYLDLIS